MFFVLVPMLQFSQQIKQNNPHFRLLLPKANLWTENCLHCPFTFFPQVLFHPNILVCQLRYFIKIPFIKAVIPQFHNMKKSPFSWNLSWHFMILVTLSSWKFYFSFVFTEHSGFSFCFWHLCSDSVLWGVILSADPQRFPKVLVVAH